MYHIVHICSLNNTVKMKQTPKIKFRPAGNYSYINIFEEQVEAETFFKKAELFVLNYEMFSHVAYHNDSSDKTYSKNQKKFFESILDENFKETERMFKEEFSPFCRNLVDVEVIKLIQKHFSTPEFFRIYKQTTIISSKKKQLSKINEIVAAKEQEEREQQIKKDISFINSARRWVI